MAKTRRQHGKHKRTRARKRAIKGGAGRSRRVGASSGPLRSTLLRPTGEWNRASFLARHLPRDVLENIRTYNPETWNNVERSLRRRCGKDGGTLKDYLNSILLAYTSQNLKYFNEQKQRELRRQRALREAAEAEELRTLSPDTPPDVPPEEALPPNAARLARLQSRLATFIDQYVPEPGRAHDDQLLAEVSWDARQRRRLSEKVAEQARESGQRHQCCALTNNGVRCDLPTHELFCKKHNSPHSICYWNTPR